MKENWNSSNELKSTINGFELITIIPRIAIRSIHVML